MVLVVGLPLILSSLLALSAAAQAESVSWVWPTSSGTCWQGGCATVGHGYVLSHGLANGEAVSGDVLCGYHNLAGNLSTRMTKAETANAGSYTGFTPPAPVQEYQLGDGLGDICQAWGPEWGYQLGDCPEAWCGMGQLVTGIPATKPWSASYGQPKVVVSGWIDANKVESYAAASGWGFICPYFAGPDNVSLEYCIKALTLEVRGGGNYWAPGTVVCGVGALNVANVIAEFNGNGAFATNLGPGTAKSWSGTPTGWVNFNASISGSQLEAVIKTILNERGSGQACANWPNLSTNPAEYTLEGITAGFEFHGGAAVGLSINNLAISTEYTPLPPEATTNAASEVQQTNATLNGTVNPNGTDTHYHFQYGETTAYGFLTPETDAGSGTNSVPESTGVTELQPGTTYHYRLTASNAADTSYGSDQTFETPQMPFLRIAVFAGVTEMAVEGPNHTLVQYLATSKGWQAGTMAGAGSTYSSPQFTVSGGVNEVIVQGAEHTLWQYLATSEGWKPFEIAGPNSVFSNPVLQEVSPGVTEMAVEGPNHTLVQYLATSKGWQAGTMANNAF
jgi:hypothetical protein